MQVAMGHDYLKNVVKLKFPELRARAAAAEAQAQAREVSHQMSYYNKSCRKHTSRRPKTELNFPGCLMRN